MSRTITAMYRSRSDADAAASQLRSSGISDVDVVDQSSPSYSASTTTHESRGLWGAMKDMFLPDDDRDTYAEGVRRGNAVLTARVEDAEAERVEDMLERTEAVDVDSEVSTWRESGWAPSAATGASAMASGAVREDRATFDTAPVDAMRMDTARTGVADDQVIPIVEEQFSVAKRDVTRGGARVRSYVVETPVSEQVNLREEHVSVERRPVGERIEGNVEDLLRERTIEVTEHAEEAVIGKRAVVTEELVVHKDVDTRSETVTDSVRRTEVEVDRLDGDRVGTDVRR